MTSKEFAHWVAGFIEGNNTIPEWVRKSVKEKYESIQNPLDAPKFPMPMTEPMKAPCLTGDCPFGGCHEYPLIWHGTTSPPCIKCGSYLNGYNINCNVHT